MSEGVFCWYGAHFDCYYSLCPFPFILVYSRRHSPRLRVKRTVFSTYNETRSLRYVYLSKTCCIWYIGRRPYRHDGAKISNREDSRGHCLGCQCDLGIKASAIAGRHANQPIAFLNVFILTWIPSLDAITRMVPFHYDAYWHVYWCALGLYGCDDGRMDGSGFQWLPSGLVTLYCAYPEWFK